MSSRSLRTVGAALTLVAELLEQEAAARPPQSMAVAETALSRAAALAREAAQLVRVAAHTSQEADDDSAS